MSLTVILDPQINIWCIAFHSAVACFEKICENTAIKYYSKLQSCAYETANSSCRNSIQVQFGHHSSKPDQHFSKVVEPEPEPWFTGEPVLNHCLHKKMEIMHFIMQQVSSMPNFARAMPLAVSDPMWKSAITSNPG
jgi:hypothetical protein